MNDPTADEEARQKKQAENPLVTYFGGQQKPKPAQAPAIQAPGQPAAPPARTVAAAPSTNVGAGAQTSARPGQANLAPVQQPQAQQPTDFTNFQRYFSANQAASERTAAALGGRASLQAAQAQKALKASQQQFGLDVAGGTVQGPELGTGNADDGSGGLTGESTRPELGGGLTSAQMAANAEGTYTGPGSLGDTKGIDDTYSKALGAQQTLDALGTGGGLQALIQQGNPQGDAGTSKLSAGLVNAAGRGDFDKLRARFNPQADLNKAVTASGDQATAAAAQSAKNAAAWATQAGIKGTQEAQEQAFQQAKATAAGAAADAKTAANAAKMPELGYQDFRRNAGPDTPQNRQDYMMGGVDRNDPKAVQQRLEEIAAYQKAQEMTTQNQMDQTFADVNAVFSPSTMIANATGNKDQTQTAAQNQYNKSGIASASGSTDQNHIPWDKFGPDGFFVWRSMTPADWNDLNQHPSRSIFGNDKQAWISTRMAQLRAKAGQGTSSPSAGRSQQ